MCLRMICFTVDLEDSCHVTVFLKAFCNFDTCQVIGTKKLVQSPMCHNFMTLLPVMYSLPERDGGSVVDIT